MSGQVHQSNGIDAGRLEWRDPRELRPHPKNATIYRDEPDEAMIADVREVGVRVPLLIDEQGRIISGHRRWRAALVCKRRRVRVIVESFTDEGTVVEELIRQNRTRRKTYSQRAREGAAIEPRFAGRKGQNQHRQKVAHAPDETDGKSVRLAADAIGMNYESYRQLRFVYRRTAEAQRNDQGEVLPDDATEADRTLAHEVAKLAETLLLQLDSGNGSLKAAYTAVRDLASHKPFVPENVPDPQRPQPNEESPPEWQRQPPIYGVGVYPADHDEPEEPVIPRIEPTPLAEHMAVGWSQSQAQRDQMRRSDLRRLIAAEIEFINAVETLRRHSDPGELRHLLDSKDVNNWRRIAEQLDAARDYCLAVIEPGVIVTSGREGS